MATAQELINRAANDLRILRLGQTLQSQDNTRITDAYAEVYATLKKDGLATWAYANEVPDELVPHVSALVADNCLSTYAVSQDLYQRIKNQVGVNGEIARREIRKLVTPDFVSQDDPTDY
jgi:hypothetical protein